MLLKFDQVFFGSDQALGATFFSLCTDFFEQGRGVGLVVFQGHESGKRNTLFLKAFVKKFWLGYAAESIKRGWKC